jgi:hypothetical protein
MNTSEKMIKDGTEGDTNRSNERKHVAGDVAFGKSGPGICEEVLPFPFESRIVGMVSECRIIPSNHFLGEVSFEPSTPFSQSSGVI